MNRSYMEDSFESVILSRIDSLEKEIEHVRGNTLSLDFIHPKTGKKHEVILKVFEGIELSKSEKKRIEAQTKDME